MNDMIFIVLLMYLLICLSILSFFFYSNMQSRSARIMNVYIGMNVFGELNYDYYNARTKYMAVGHIERPVRRIGLEAFTKIN